ncbi:MAG: hypothetical protein M1833_005149 [Piccolia ochrophora]|nr:MAG: hypothetical protein M1833_005149 [Piccolia ochrophora]
MTYAVTEPHPHPSTSYMHTGRGGVGNAVRVSASTKTSSKKTPPTNASVLPPSSHRFTTGRGGAGNVHPASEQRAMFSFDEEIARERARAEHAAPVIHVGRGGAGNKASSIRSEGGEAGRKSWESEEPSPRGSEESGGSKWRRVSGAFSRGS